MIYFKKIITTFIFISVIFSKNVINPDSLRYKVAYATRCEVSPVIDGILNETTWNNSVVISDFLQLVPVEFDKPSEKTEVRILYDDNAIYISFLNFDSNPKKIRAPLTRRDAYMDGFNTVADFIGVAVDSRNDDFNGKWFGVNAAGVKIDVNVSGQENYDRSWDAVWDAAVSQNDSSWTAEIRIPFSVFQYEDKDEMVWGISLNRHVHRTQEEFLWPGRRRSHVGIVSSFGILEGLKNIPEPKKLEIVPYFLSSSRQSESQFNLGADLRYGVSSNAIINATVNPDFGQVEADPSVLNLSAFETFYEEKRPFFSEGASFFKNRLNLFNSRRIGASPNFFDPDSGDLENVSDNTTIIGAIKLIGTTNSGINYGFINAITREESGDLFIGDNKNRFVVEPQTSYSVGKLEKSILNKFSRVGLMYTDVTRKNSTGANVLGLDWKIGLLNNRLFSNGQIVRSNANESGDAFRFNIGYKNATWWESRFWLGSYDDKFDINDLGYLRRNDMTWSGMMFKIRRLEPIGYLLGSSFEIKLNKKWGIDDILKEDELSIETWTLLKNYWRFGLNSFIKQPAYNDEDIFRDDNAWVYETEKFWYNGFWIKSDRRKKLILSIDAGMGNAKLRGKGYYSQFEIDYKPIDPLNLSLEFKRDISPNYMQYVDIIEDGSEIIRVYAKTKQITDQIQLRLDWTFSPDLTFQGYFQPFYADITYDNFSNLLAPETMNLGSYDYLSNYDNPNFKIENNVGTFVLRWEYRPGSTIFVVYNINENRYFSASDNEWSKESNNAFVIKLNYWSKI